MTDDLKAAEQQEFPPIPDDKVWCEVRAKLVGVGECVDNCADPSHRPVCWIGKMPEEPTDG